MRRPVLIRSARTKDGGAILSMLSSLAASEDAPHPPRLTRTALARDVFCETPKLRVLVAERAPGQLVGFISYYENYSSWEGAAGIHIGDLWVSLEHRGEGIGAALLNYVTSQNVDRRVDVFVVRGNPASSFYERLGFEEQTQWCLFRKQPL